MPSVRQVCCIVIRTYGTYGMYSDTYGTHGDKYGTYGDYGKRVVKLFSIRRL